MKQYERLAGAIPLDEASDVSLEEADAIVSVFSAWFEVHVRTREASRRQYAKLEEKSMPTLEQIYALSRYKTHRASYPEVCFDFPHHIYKWNKNPLSEKIHAIYGSTQHHAKIQNPADLRLDIQSALDTEWSDRDFAANRKAKDVQTARRRRDRQATGHGGNAVRRAGDHGHNPSLRKVDSEIHYRSREKIRGGKRIQEDGDA